MNDETATSVSVEIPRSDDIVSAGVEQPPTRRKPRWVDAPSLAEAGLLADVGLIFDLASIYVPILGTAFVPLTPAPFAILYLRRGARTTILAALVAGFLMTTLAGPHYGWRLSLQALVGMAMGIAMRRQWRPLFAIALGTLIVTTVAYGAAFGAVFALGLPLRDIFGELRNALHSLTWLLQTAAIMLGARGLWAQAAPWVESATAFILRYWIAMFYLHAGALALPTVVLYYGVASSTAYALGHDVKPFPAPWVWRALRVVSVALTPVGWLIALAFRVVTSPLWAPGWAARWVGRRRRMSRLRAELAARAPAPVPGDGAESAPASPPETVAP